VHERIRTLLLSTAIRYREIRHSDFPEPIRSPADFARALGCEEARITKTLLVKAGDEFCLVVLPAPSRLHFSKLAAMQAKKRYSMASREEVAQLLDYPPLSVSPLASRGIPVIIDSTLQAYDTVFVGAGSVGVEIELAPSDLIALTHAQTAVLS
jgi:Cys-tRNA(Pro)/Cys-tRNA(Cys) deacylase